jgi:hypothetical protein
MFIVLEGRAAEFAKVPGSSSRRLVTALRQQIVTAEAARSSKRGLDRWRRNLGRGNRAFTLAIVSILLILSLTFGLGSAFQIRQAEGAGFSFFGMFSGLLSARGPEGATGSGAVQETPTPQSALETYGTGFTWPDRFIEVKVQRETMSSKVLWPISTLISTLILGVWLLPHPNQ